MNTYRWFDSVDFFAWLFCFFYSGFYDPKYLALQKVLYLLVLNNVVIIVALIQITNSGISLTIWNCKSIDNKNVPTSGPKFINYSLFPYKLCCKHQSIDCFRLKLWSMVIVCLANLSDRSVCHICTKMMIVNLQWKIYVSERNNHNTSIEFV